MLIATVPKVERDNQWCCHFQLLKQSWM